MRYLLLFCSYFFDLKLLHLSINRMSRVSVFMRSLLSLNTVNTRLKFSCKCFICESLIYSLYMLLALRRVSHIYYILALWVSQYRCIVLMDFQVLSHTGKLHTQKSFLHDASYCSTYSFLKWSGIAFTFLCHSFQQVFVRSFCQLCSGVTATVLHRT